MPSEIRHVVFRNVEVARAVRAYLERTGTAMPRGELLDCSIETSGPGQDTRFAMTIASLGGRAPVVVVADGAQLAAALILYCRSERIPLPAAAAKSLAVFGDSLCLVVTHNPRGLTLPDTPVRAQCA